MVIAYNVRIVSPKILSFAMIEKILKYWQRDINVSSRVLRQHALMSAGVSENGCSFKSFLFPFFAPPPHILLHCFSPENVEYIKGRKMVKIHVNLGSHFCWFFHEMALHLSCLLLQQEHCVHIAFARSSH